MRTLLLTKEEVRGLVAMRDVIATVEDAYRAFSSGQVLQPPYIGIDLPGHRGEIDFKLGYNQANEVISMKASSGGFTGNPETHGVPNGMGTLLLFDGRHGGLLCVMDGSLLTGLRTGAAGAVSVKALARPGARTVTCIGTGNQARMQVCAIREVMAIGQVHAWSNHAESMARFKADIESAFDLPVVLAASRRAAVEQAEILVTTTRGTGAVVEAAWVQPGTHIVAIGSDAPGKQEFEPEVVRGAKVVVDSIAQCVEKGEIQHAVARGLLRPGDIHAEIGEILLGRKPGRASDGEITLFDSTGMAIQDNTTAVKIYRNALAQGIGTFFAFS